MKERLKAASIDTMTPLEALNLLYELKQKVDVLMHRDRIPFTSNMTRTQTIQGVLVLPAHATSLSCPCFWACMRLLPRAALDEVALNIVYYGAGIAFVLILHAEISAGVISMRSSTGRGSPC